MSERYQALAEKVYENYASINWLPLRMEALLHTQRVIDAIALQQTDLDLELRMTAALLHDYARFMNNITKQHGPESAKLVKPMLEEAGYTYEEVKDICDAIACHSHKKRIDSPLAESLKDADIMARWLEDPSYEHARLPWSQSKQQD